MTVRTALRAERDPDARKRKNLFPPPGVLRPRTIGARLAFWYGAVLVLTLLVLGVGVYQAFRHSLLLGAEEAVRLTAEEMGRFLHSSEEKADLDGTYLDLADPDLVRKFSQPGLYLQIRDARGKTLSRWPEPGPAMGGDAMLAERVREGERVRTVEAAGAPWGSLLVYSLPVVTQGRVVGMVQVARQLGPVFQSLERLRNILVLAGLVALLFSGGLGLWLARAALRPVDRVTQAAREIASACRASRPALNRRLNLVGPDDEVTRLGAAFDEMLEQLERAFSRERQFTADASHELRTPVTAVRGLVDVSLRAATRRESAYRATLADIGEEARRMGRIIEGLLLLARADAGELAVHMAAVDFREVVEAVARRARARETAQAKGLRIVGPSGPSGSLGLVGPNGGAEAAAAVRGDRQKLEQLVDNLVDNALKYTPAGGTVSLVLATGAGWVRLDVADTGIGIPAEDLEHVFQRFYRVDKARSNDGSGSGLGLSIARQIAAVHGGRIELRSEFGRGTTATVWLPLATGPIERG